MISHHGIVGVVVCVVSTVGAVVSKTVSAEVWVSEAVVCDAVVSENVVSENVVSKVVASEIFVSDTDVSDISVTGSDTVSAVSSLGEVSVSDTVVSDTVGSAMLSETASDISVAAIFSSSARYAPPRLLRENVMLRCEAIRIRLFRALSVRAETSASSGVSTISPPDDVSRARLPAASF